MSPALTRHHLRLGFLVHERPLAARAVYRYLSDLRAGRGRRDRAERRRPAGDARAQLRGAVAMHLELAREMLPTALAWRAHRPRPRSAGDELARALGIVPGPQLGRLLAELTEAAYAGEMRDRESRRSRTRASGSRSGRGTRAERRRCDARRLGCHREGRGLHLLQDRRRRDPGADHCEDERTLAFMDIAPGDPWPRAGDPASAHAPDIWRSSPTSSLAVALGGAAPGARDPRPARRRRRQPDQLLRPAAWQTVFHFHIHVIPRYAATR